MNDDPKKQFATIDIESDTMRAEFKLPSAGPYGVRDKRPQVLVIAGSADGLGKLFARYRNLNLENARVTIRVDNGEPIEGTFDACWIDEEVPQFIQASGNRDPLLLDKDDRRYRVIYGGRNCGKTAALKELARQQAQFGKFIESALLEVQEAPKPVADSVKVIKQLPPRTHGKHVPYHQRKWR